MRIYLGGPINGCSDDEAKSWREAVKPLIESVGWESVDPMVRDYRGKEDESVNEIVENDKDDIDNSDVVLAYCPKPSVGTSMEVFYAWLEDKEVIVIVPPDAPVSPWLRYHSSEVFRGYPDELVARLVEEG